jgi:hypothetical protein
VADAVAIWERQPDCSSGIPGHQRVVLRRAILWWSSSANLETAADFENKEMIQDAISGADRMLSWHVASTGVCVDEYCRSCRRRTTNTTR